MGRQLKPWACRLFPFTSLTRMGTLLVVGINWSDALACPFVARKPGEGMGISHAEILFELRGFGPRHPAISLYPKRAPELDSEHEALASEEGKIRERLKRLLGEVISPLQMASAASGCTVARLEEILCRIEREIPYASRAFERIRKPDRASALMAGALLPMLRWEVVRLRPRLGYRKPLGSIGEIFLHLLLYSYSLHDEPGLKEILRIQSKLETTLFLLSLMHRPVGSLPPHGMIGDSVEAVAIRCVLDSGRPLTLLEVLRAGTGQSKMSASEALKLLGSVQGLGSSIFALQDS